MKTVRNKPNCSGMWGEMYNGPHQVTNSRINCEKSEKRKQLKKGPTNVSLFILERRVSVLKIKTSVYTDSYCCISEILQKSTVTYTSWRWNSSWHHWSQQEIMMTWDFFELVISKFRNLDLINNWDSMIWTSDNCDVAINITKIIPRSISLWDVKSPQRSVITLFLGSF